MRKAVMGTALAIGLAWAATPASAQTVRGVTDKEVIIGTYTDLSGVTAMWGVNNMNSWRMVFDEANAAGGVHGRMIKHIIEDSQYQVPRAVQASNKLLNRDNVFAMVANGGTPMNNATMPEQLTKGVPNVFPLTSARSMYAPFHPLKFGLAASYYDMMRAGVKLYAEQRGKKAFCAMSQDTDFGRDIMEGVHDQMKAMNTKLVTETLHKPADTDFTASVARLRDAKCDVVLLGTIVRDTIQIVASARKTGWDVDFLGQVAIYDEAVASAPGGVTEGIYALTSVLFAHPDDPRPRVREVAEKYRKLFGKDPNFAAQLGHTAASLVVLGLKNAGRDLTPQSFVKGLEMIKDYEDAFGSPKLSYGPDKHQGSSESFLAVVKNGKWVPASDKSFGY